MPRTALQEELSKALVDANVVDFTAAGSILAKYAPEAASRGESVGLVVNWRHIDLCIPVDPYLHESILDQLAGLERQLQELRQQIG